MHLGWTAGAGIEQPLTGNALARIEYPYDDYGNENYLVSGFYVYKAKVDLNAHTMRVGLSYRF